MKKTHKSKSFSRPTTLEELLENLPDIERDALTHRLGLFGEEKKTWKEIAKLLAWGTDKVTMAYRKSIRRLRRKPIAYYFPFMTDDMLQEVFRTTNIEKIVVMLADGMTFDSMHAQLENTLETHLRKVEDLIEQQKSFNSRVANNYDIFVNTLQGSELNKFLNQIDRMAKQLQSQCVNMQSTLGIAQKFLGTEIKLPQTQIQEFFDKFATNLYDMERLEERFRESIDYKQLIYKRGLVDQTVHEECK